MESLEEVLAHHGIRGMRWGIRRKRGPGGTVGSGSPSHPATSEDAANAKEFHDRAKTHGTHTLSNKELQHLVNRINLEQQYSRVTSNQGKKNAGKKFAKEILIGVGKTQITKLASDAATKAVSGALRK